MPPSTFPRSSSRPSNGRTALLLAALLVPACGGRFDGGDDDDLEVQATTHAASPDLEPLVVGRWLVYFANEFATGTGGGTDLNGDTVRDDDVPVVVDTRTGTTTSSGVASRHAAIRGDDVYFVVDEAADQRDWGGAATATDVVLLHWSSALGGPALVDVLAADPTDLAGDRPLVAVAEDKVFYEAEASTLSGDETSLRWVDGSMPRTPTPVLNQDMAGTLRPRLLGVDEGLLLLTLDENDDGVNRNGAGALGTDMDSTDPDVLALLDVRDAAVPRVKNVGLAVNPDAFRARSTGNDEWLVAFLVPEAEQGGENLNDPALFAGIVDWLPPGCPATDDGDATDDVLFYLEYQDFLSDVAGPVNTGLPGRDRVLAMDGWVATLVDESDADCDYDGDGGTGDRVLRWMGVGAPILPAPAATEYHAVSALLDDSLGVARLGGHFVCVVDEANDGSGPMGTDHNGDGSTDAHLLARIDPATETSWTFLHGTPSSAGGPIPFYAGVEWMGDRPTGAFLPIAFQESVVQPGDTVAETRNFTCDGAHDDMDAVDAIPVWVTLSGGEILLPGVGFALADGNPGLRLTSNQVFFRVSESEHGLDLSGDTDTGDAVLVRNPIFACEDDVVGVASDVLGPAVFTDGVEAAAFLTDEAQAGSDLNGDGNMPVGELTLRWFRF